MREVVGIVLAVPQGLVPLVLMALDVDGKSWFLVRYLPEWAQLPAAVVFVVVGGVIAVSGMRAERRGR
ncbi:hypothetical protein [Saccharothrix sp.]|uniref:hypothetical protein n=1 Tax=Saccharothrix sp. TaxID=1873460 RepID=UPI0028124254|nr:hypothetical protein [Saccharothrix sp.]